MEFGSLAVALALVYALFTAIGITLNRYYLKDILEHPATLLFIGKVTTTIVAVTIGVAVGVSIPTEITVIGFIIIVGLIKSVPLYKFYQVIKEADASVVTPIISIQPVFTVILAAIILGERLEPVQYVSVLLVLFGITYLMWLRTGDAFFSFGDVQGTFFYNRHIVWAFILAFVWSFEAIIVKLILGYQDIVTVFLWTSVAAFVFSLVFLYKKEARSELTNLKTYNSKAVLAYLSTELITAVGWLALVAALAYGPVKIVAPVLHSYSIFLFTFVIIIQMYGPSLDTELAGTKMTQKSIATIFAITGILLLFVV